MKKVLFACAQNVGRSQMAAAFFNSFCAPSLVKAISAGPAPLDRVQPGIIQAMKEIGIDLRATRPQLLTPDLARSADLLVSLGCGDLCPAMPGQRRIEWSLEGPEDQSLDELRLLRDELRRRIWRLVAKEGWYKLQPASAIRSWSLQTGT
jgi:arsenate reductase